MRNKTWDIVSSRSILRRFLGRKRRLNGIVFIHPDIPTDSGRKATSLTSFLFYVKSLTPTSETYRCFIL